VGYKADNLAEVAAFLAGSGVVNPGTTTTEAANWLQVTERMTYNNTTPVLLDPDNTTSDLIYLTPDLVYENNGSGTLRLLERASEETTVGQSITYYCCKPSGLDAYTVVAPIAALKVIDGDSGHFRMVKFNLGNRYDLMVPFVHTFIKDLSNTQVSKLFLAGAHVSIYIAHYEVIEHAGMSFLTALVLIIIIVVVAYYTYQMDGGETTKMLLKAAVLIGEGAVILAVQILFKVLAQMVLKMVVQMIIEQIIIAVFPDSPELQMILNLVAAVAISAWDGNVTYGSEAPGFIGPLDPTAPKSFHFSGMKSFTFKSFSDLTPLDFAEIATSALNGFNRLLFNKVDTLGEELERDIRDFERSMDLDREHLAGAGFLFESDLDVGTVLSGVYAVNNETGIGHRIYDLLDHYYEMGQVPFEITGHINQKVSIEHTLPA